MENEISDQVEGRNSVLELLESDNDINKLYVQSGEKHGAIIKIIAKAKEKKVVISEIDKNKLDQMSETHNHQGVIAIVPPYNYSSVEEILELAKSKNEKPFVIICDGIEDPHNLGSIIRTAEWVGAHGVIIPKRRSAAVNAKVNKTSTGAVAYVKVARVTNLNDTIKELQDNGVWIYGTDMDGTDNYNEVKYDSGVGIVVGSEGFGMSRLVKENCDFLIRIPMAGKINSLNASVSASIVMYEVMNQRKK